jgi:topoisomerase-4 subunit B
MNLNGKRYVSKNGLLDLLQRKTNEDEIRYPIIHLKGEDIEVAITHENAYGEEYYSFVNGQFTTQGGTHLSAFREGYVKTIREFYKKDYDAADIRGSICSAISVRVQEPVFESQTKTKLGSQNVYEGGPSMRNFIGDFLSRELDNYLHKNTATAEALKKRIEQNERERKELAGIKKLANERAKKANLHNKKLRIVSFITTMNLLEKTKIKLPKSKKKPQFLLRKGIVQVVALQRLEVWKHKQYLVYEVNR